MIFVNLPTPPPIPSLPQRLDEERKAIRAKKLEETREQYQLTTTRKLPLDLSPNGEKITSNIPLLVPPVPLVEAYSDKYQTLRNVAAAEMVENAGIVSAMTPNPFEKVTALADYEKQFIDLDLPDVAKLWMDDLIFAEQRISGANPVSIKRMHCKNFPEALDTEQLAKKLHHSDIKEWVNKHQVFVVDHAAILSEVVGGKITVPLPPEMGGPKQFQKYVPKTIGIFKWDDKAVKDDPNDKPGRLIPLAIQVDVGNDKHKIVVPDPKNPKDMDWLIAKLCFSVADANVHEMHVHLGINHFAQEAFGAVTPRQLSENHPLHIFLKPHLRFLVWNNEQGVQRLIQPSGPVDILMGGDLKSSIETALKAAQNFRIDHNFLKDLENRGMDNHKEMPHYPYRDDGKLLWSAIEEYVRDYMQLYYKTDADLKEDYELQAWAKELASAAEDGGNVKEMPSEIMSMKVLVDVVTMIVFTASVGHCAVNYPQFPYMGFAPNMPASGYADYQAYFNGSWDDEKSSLDFLLEFLPPKFCALTQIQLTSSLSTYHYDQLGEFAENLHDAEAKQVRYRFEQRLEKIEQRINRRNGVRFVPYPYLLPSEVLNSASI